MAFYLINEFHCLKEEYNNEKIFLHFNNFISDFVNSFRLGYGSNFLKFEATNTSNKYAYLTADGLKNIKLAVSNSN